MKIIDTHAHIGVSRFSGVEITERELLETMDRNGIAASLVMPQPVLAGNESAVHERIAALSNAHPKRFFGIVCIDPWTDEEPYRKEAEKCLDAFGFRALKINCLGHNISPLSVKCEKIYQMAKERNLPVVVHTGLGSPNSLPALLIEPARRYPEVNFVMAHAGFAEYSDEAIIAARVCENIVLEPSWCPTYMVRKMVNQIGSDRLIMGSDHLTNLPTEHVKYRYQSKDSELEQIFFRNPDQLFRLDLSHKDDT